ncbi:prolipoprotein diacylglyceryl transferase [Paenarthrobacter sp. PH39-S1]|uniref:prolipoprotein diacylglyceryl transferase n=1 Tax=Paenarthrobacter sp. PH39-S1 TaxID=3046204 RepID=UPI0024BA28E1|nr:prolipoprotein diacylglyceryl transferase [Paenarthrobacter sp. PH39-S1]MDJ0354565.1 prolipoprotein diacylglyceryl transferase [Paenarthrobacter sp. PH39-S1]
MNPAAASELFFPSPAVDAFQLGPLTIRFYALCILAGIVFAVWLADRRLTARGGRPGVVLDITIWAVPFGIVGGRIYHVITDPELYFFPGKNPWDALKIWDGGLGIWGAVALGLLGAYLGCRRHNVPFTALIDSAAPGLLIAQGLGRWGNWFNNELYGDPTALPWKLQIHQMDFSTGRAATDAAGAPVVLGYFQPTFLYESLWCLAAASLLMFLDRRYRLGAGSVFALYVVFYTSGRFIFELLRSDYANTILGLRVNTWVSGLLLLAGLAGFLLLRRRDRSTAQLDSPDTEPIADTVTSADGTTK